MAQPLFVIGKNRSGTKWLSNILARHPRIATIQGRRSGILETCMFDRTPRTFGDLRVGSNFYAFAACYSRSDFFRLTGLPERALFELQSRDYHEIFRSVMDLYSQRQDKPFWLQKSSSNLLPDLVTHFPDAKFLVIRRGIEDNLRSTAALRTRRRGRGSWLQHLREIASYHHHVKTENSFLGRKNFLLLRFEDLRRSPEETARQACSFLGIPFAPEMLDTGFRANTSFDGRVSADEAFSRGDRLAFAVANPVFRALPLSVLNLAFATGHRQPARLQGKSRLHPAYFNLLKKELEAEGTSP